MHGIVPSRVTAPTRGTLTAAASGTPTEIDCIAADRVVVKCSVRIRYVFAALAATAVSALAAGTAVQTLEAGRWPINCRGLPAVRGRYLYIEADSGGAVANGLEYHTELA